MMRTLYKGLYTEKEEYLRAFDSNYSAASGGEYKNTLIIGEINPDLEDFDWTSTDTSAENLRKLSVADSVIIEIEIGKTKINDIIEIIQRVDFYGKDFLGFIVLV